jgi:hypothetical protein
MSETNWECYKTHKGLLIKIAARESEISNLKKMIGKLCDVILDLSIALNENKGEGNE